MRRFDQGVIVGLILGFVLCMGIVYTYNKYAQKPTTVAAPQRPITVYLPMRDYTPRDYKMIFDEDGDHISLQEVPRVGKAAKKKR